VSADIAYTPELLDDLGHTYNIFINGFNALYAQIVNEQVNVDVNSIMTIPYILDHLKQGSDDVYANK
jgi:hypothetical protein